MGINKLLNLILVGILLVIVIMFIRIPIREKKTCEKKVSLQEKIFDNILTGQKFIAEYRPKLNRYIPACFDSIVSGWDCKDKIILRVSENSCYSCIEAITSIITEKFDFKDFVLLTSYKNAYLANRIELFQLFPYRINSADLSEKLGDTDINFIYCIKIDPERKVKEVFVPVKEFPAYNKNGFEMLFSD